MSGIPIPSGSSPAFSVVNQPGFHVEILEQVGTLQAQKVCPVGIDLLCEKWIAQGDGTGLNGSNESWVFIPGSMQQKRGFVKRFLIFTLRP